MTLEALGVTILTIGAIATALVAVGVILKRLWSFLRRFIATVDVIAVLPESLKRIDDKIDRNSQRLDDHLIDAKLKTALLVDVDKRTKALVDITEDVRYEVKNNGGGSVKDSIDRIETGVQGLYARPGESGVAGREPEPA